MVIGFFIIKNLSIRLELNSKHSLHLSKIYQKNEGVVVQICPFWNGQYEGFNATIAGCTKSNLILIFGTLINFINMRFNRVFERIPFLPT